MATKRPRRRCADCREWRPVAARGLCWACYHRLRRTVGVEYFPLADRAAASRAGWARRRAANPALARDAVAERRRAYLRAYLRAYMREWRAAQRLVRHAARAGSA